MKPNKYQQIVLDDLRSFLVRWRLTNNPVTAFNEHWLDKGVSRMGPYHSAATNAPQICTKVPTAGGKTLIGIYALQEILNAMDKRQGEPRVCVWLVPSLSIKDQVLRRFNMAGDGYWLALREALGHRVSVLSKEDLLGGSGKFNAQRVREEVFIAVLTYDSLRSKKVEGRKLYQSNSELSSFDADIAVSEPDEGFDSDSLVAALASLQPVVIVDESHNATSELSRESIDRLKPSCVLELTATPRQTANIISFVDAMALRDEHMVKLPVVVRNLLDQSAVISHAIDLQKRLEAEAIAEQSNGGFYIRPIVLFQAEPKNKTDSLTFEKLKDQLVKERNIDPSWIKIKTANVDELKKEDLLSPNCPVRFIITVNALKEGWDCNFAYILATLADRSSPIDVEQILGRILRQPNIRKHGKVPLNMSYVLTSSTVFSEALEKIVAGLNRAGFSRNDYRTPDAIEPVSYQQTTQEQTESTTFELTVTGELLSTTNENPLATDINTSAASSEALEAKANASTSDNNYSADSTIQYGEAANSQLDSVASKTDGQYIAPEQREMMNNFPIRKDFAAEIAELKLPQFFRRAPTGSLFIEKNGGALLDKNMLLEGFRLVDCNINDFKANLSSGDVAQIDLKELNAEGIADYEPTRISLKPHEITTLRNYLATLTPDAKRRQLSGLVSSWLGKMPPLSEPDLRAYISKLLERLTPDELDSVVEQQNVFVETVRKRVRLEMKNYRQKTLAQWVRTNTVFADESFSFPKESSPVSLYAPTSNTLYEREEKAKSSDIEKAMTDWLAESPNICWWHRNHQSRGFFLNGSINHYPDFIARTYNGTIVLIETKGEHLKNDDSDTKVELGKLWQDCAGRKFRYIMVFEQTPLDGALSWQDAIEVLNAI